MTTDITRSTFRPAKHYARVIKQQGRVELDADWNEESDIQLHRAAVSTRDVVGACGAPLENAGFAFVKPVDLSMDEQTRLIGLGVLPLATGDFLLGPGHFYVDGILCENEQAVSFVHQPDLLDAGPLLDPGRYLIYLDVWQRTITALEDPAIREVALGGPDTAARAKTVWQVKALRVEQEGLNCQSDIPAWNDLTAPSAARLSARGAPPSAESGPCIVPPGAGFRRLENQLYRVEIHHPGVLGTATFKWSRINASKASAWLSQSGTSGELLQVASPGPDAALGFEGGRSVELIDDTRELGGHPGTLVGLTRVEEDILTIDPASRLRLGEDSITLADFSHNPKIRRWDSPGELLVEVPTTNDGWITLEDGVEIKFADGPFGSGDYWLIPARIVTGDVEWPRENGTPLPQPPHGVQHHFCRLALLDVTEAGNGLLDCRPVFPPLTELIGLFYRGGDGQEITPDPGIPLQPLPQPLQAGVANGEFPVAGATVRFTILAGGGRLNGKSSMVDVVTRTDGLASCTWELDSTTLNQRVEASLLDVAGRPLHLPLHFNANLSVAAAVAYDPSNCSTLSSAGVKTVQSAIDQLCQLGGQRDEPGFHITDVALAAGGQFGNGVNVRSDIFLEGIAIICDDAVVPKTVDRPTCYVTIDLPYPISDGDITLWATQNQNLGYQPIIVDGTVQVDQNVIRWIPTKAVQDWIGQQRLFKVLGELHRQDLTADNLLLTTREEPDFETYTLSGAHATEGNIRSDPTIPAAPALDVTIDGDTHGATLDFTGTTLPAQIPLEQVAPALQGAIQRATTGNPAFNDAIVIVVDNRLLVLPGGDTSAEVTFANAHNGGENPTADNLLLTSAARNVTATRTLPHKFAPTIPAAPAVDVTIGNVTRTATLDFPGTRLPAEISLEQVAPVLQRAIREAVTDNPAFNDAIVTVVGDRLLVLPGGIDPSSEVTFDNVIRLLMHLTLKGNFIWSASAERRYLDGETLALPPGQVGSNLSFPSGDGLRGGDFEMFFWLVSSIQPVFLMAATVNMTDSLKFEPADVTISKGGTVTWKNTGATVHTVTDDPSKASNPADASLPAGAKAWDSGDIQPGGSFSHTFDTAGTYKYFCIPHASAGMVGTITVK